MGRRRTQDTIDEAAAIARAATTGATVTELRAPEEEKPKPIEVRWCVPRVIGEAWAHANVPGMPLTVCGSYYVDGAIYPPPEGVPRCPACGTGITDLARAREVADASR